MSGTICLHTITILHQYVLKHMLYEGYLYSKLEFCTAARFLKIETKMCSPLKFKLTRFYHIAYQSVEHSHEIQFDRACFCEGAHRKVDCSPISVNFSLYEHASAIARKEGTCQDFICVAHA